MVDLKARFFIGQLVRHKLYDYRGVIIDVDPAYFGSDEWYENVALSRPPKDKPWYHLLVHESIHHTYVAERNLTPDTEVEPIDHPEIDEYFSEFSESVYKMRRDSN